MEYNLYMLERDLTARIGKRFRDDPRFTNCAVEVKVSKSKTLPKTALKEHQRHALEVATNGSLYFKIPDDSFGQKPFDIFILKKAQSYLVIYYDLKPKPETWVLKIQDVPEGSISITYSQEKGILL